MLINKTYPINRFDRICDFWEWMQKIQHNGATNEQFEKANERI